MKMECRDYVEELLLQWRFGLKVECEDRVGK
jgi:hypothetical protein